MYNINKYIKYFSIIFSGGIVAQLIYFSTIPILSRLYSVEDFSTLSVFSSLLIIFTSISCLRYDVAITLAEKKSDVFKLSILSLLISTIFTGFLSLLLLIGILFNFLDIFWLLLGFAVWLSSIFNIFLNTCLKNKNYKKISSIKIYQVSLMTSFQICIANIFPKIGHLGLLIGQLINYSVGGIFNIRTIASFRKIKVINLNELRKVSLRYSNYLKFSTFDSIFNLLGMHLPIIILTLVYDKFLMGLFYMGMRLLQTPLSLLMGTFSQIYHSNVKDRLNESLLSFTLKFVILLSFLGASFFTLYLALGEKVINNFLGPNWHGLMELSLWMLPWFIIQLVASPISTVMYATNNHKIMMYLTIFGFLIRVLPLVYLLNIRSIKVIEIFCSLNSIYYLICLLVFLFFSKKYGNKS